MELWGMKVCIGVRCVNCGYSVTPRPNEIRFVHTDQVYAECPECGENLWSGVPAEEASVDDGTDEA